MKPFTLEDFVRESNRIEGISKINDREVEAHSMLLSLPSLCISDLEVFVDMIQPGARLRGSPGMDVRVGKHFPPRGGSSIVRTLGTILNNEDAATPYEQHRRYETLHPFMDGNGRSGRSLWLWRMGGIERAPLGFLHHWYYQSLQEGSR